jgi:hypothetical protein
LMENVPMFMEELNRITFEGEIKWHSLINISKKLDLFLIIHMKKQ